MLVGSHLSPEQARGSKATVQSDTTRGDLWDADVTFLMMESAAHCFAALSKKPLPYSWRKIAMFLRLENVWWSYMMQLKTDGRYKSVADMWARCCPMRVKKWEKLRFLKTKRKLIQKTLPKWVQPGRRLLFQFLRYAEISSVDPPNRPFDRSTPRLRKPRRQMLAGAVCLPPRLVLCSLFYFLVIYELSQ